MLDIGADGGVRVSDSGGFQRRLGQAGRLGGPVAEAGLGEKAGSALGVVDDCDFEEPVSGDLAADELPGEKGQVGDVIDDGLGDAPARVRMTTASPSWSPRMIAGSTRWSRQVTMTTCAAGGPSGPGV